jgi:glycine/D-amino acid oxidase-like deaminating enzyme
MSRRVRVPGAGGGGQGYHSCMNRFIAARPRACDGTTHTYTEMHPPHTHTHNDGQVLLCSACSGHGFKLSPAIGLVLADMVRHHGQCAEYADELQLHKLDRRRAGHAAALDAFASG